MDRYRSNYWSLFLDFVEDFKEIVYRGYPLSYLVHFPSLIRHHANIWSEMSEKKLQDQLHHHVTDRIQVQKRFSDYLASLNTSYNRKKGYTAILEDSLIRIPSETYEKYIELNKTIFIKASKNPHDLDQHNCYYLQDYLIKSTEPSKAKMKKQIQTLLKQFPAHHLYQDSAFRYMLVKKVNFVIDHIEMMHQLLSKTAISSVIISSPNHFGRVMAFVARKHGVPTICLQHGIIANEFGYLPKVATVDAVYGQFEIDWYMQAGVLEDEIKIIGHPRFDQRYKKSSFTQEQFRKHLKLDKRKKTLLLIVRGNRHLEKWKTLIAQLEKVLNLHIILRDFPDDEHHPLLLQHQTITSTGKIPLYDVLPHVDAVVSYTSTVALEAMLVGKPVFILHTKLPSYTEYYSELKSFVQNDPLKLADVINLYFKYPRWQKAAERIRREFLAYAYPDQSSSGQRLRNLIDELSKGAIK
ncbi:hypothetical protein ACTNEO_08510 [Gracilibacillus sp. HCP3S3_G5_1]|uniref:hypothetical protein n=1 Tax=unclassified Gracilibacillus TaxID=2625209 RepID=UPI003F8B5970